MKETDIMVELEFTPNPNTLKYVVNTELIPQGVENYPAAANAEGKSPLAMELFGLQDVVGVMISKNFASVTLGSQDRLTELNEEIIRTIKNFIVSGKDAVNPDALGKVEDLTPKDLNDLEKKIVEILDNEIRPAVAMDGGDITFNKFEDNILYLNMKGACSGCPVSTVTLKQGIENRIREVIPELVDVVAVES